MKTVHNKLVRDKIPEIIRADGRIPVCRVLDADAYLSELARKLKEETAEFLEEYDPMELADLYEVLDALAQALGGREKILEMQASKRERNGAFEQRIYLEEVLSDE